MIYIKKDSNNHVTLGGTVATEEMLNEGYYSYYGTVPQKGLLVWDETTSAIISDITSLKISKLVSLKIDYENANQLDIEYFDTTFQADKYSQNLVVSVLSAGSVPDEFFWLDTTNNQVTMTYGDLQGFSSVILARSQINFVKYQDLKSQVSTATTIDELDSVVW